MKYRYSELVSQVFTEVKEFLLDFVWVYEFHKEANRRFYFMQVPGLEISVKIETGKKGLKDLSECQYDIFLKRNCTG